jgi:pyruvate-formate lyase-activating enzyme
MSNPKINHTFIIYQSQNTTPQNTTPQNITPQNITLQHIIIPNYDINEEERDILDFLSSQDKRIPNKFQKILDDLITTKWKKFIIFPHKKITGYKISTSVNKIYYL